MVPKEQSPNFNRIVDCHHGFAVRSGNNQPVAGKVIHLRRGNTYIFKFTCDIDIYNFMLTADSVGGKAGNNCIPHGYCPSPLPGTRVIRGGEELRFTVNESCPPMFYYHSAAYAHMGGAVIVH